MRYSKRFLVSLLVVLSGCASVPPSKEALQQAYAAAVADARVAEPSEIVTDLVAITPYQPGLVWEGEPGASRVKVVTWTDQDFFDGSVGKEYTLPRGANVWITLVPQLKDFLVPTGDTSNLRIEQLLGLPPDTGKSKFVELWVDPADMFRPCPDPEVIDTTCGLSFATTDNRFLSFTNETIVDWKGDKQVAMTYSQWFDNRTETGYDEPNPYPWTRLGYTYDWARPHDPVGMSEYVVLGETTVGVAAVVPTAVYLR